MTTTGHLNIDNKPWWTKTPAPNSTFAIGGFSCSEESFVVKESFVLRMNISAEKPAHRKSAKR
jgi:hypothetical protein